KTYPIAWVALFFLVVLRAAVSIYNNTFSPIPVVTAKYLDVDLTSVNWLFNIQAVVFIFVSFFTSWLFESLGVKKSLIIGGGLITLGCWIRWIAVKIQPHSFALLMVGQVIAAISSPITLNIMTKFAAVWFTEDRRATAGMFVASNYGGIIAMFLMPAVATGEDRIEFTIIMVAVIATAASIPQLFLPALPPKPPSIDMMTTVSHDTDDPTTKVSLRKGTLALIKNIHFWILCGIHGINVGLSISWGGLFNQAITPYGYSNAEAGNIVAVGLVAGTLGCLIAGPILDSTKKHKLFLKLMAPLVCSTYVAMIFLIKQDSFAAILYVNGLNQFFLSFMVPIVVELGVEVTYPVPESISTSMLWQIAQVFGFILVLVMDNFRDPSGSPPNNMDRGLIFQAVTSGVCV
ncbi:major facilitator superfamily domain-containing protein, partial [Absidia repens]